MENTEDQGNRKKKEPEYKLIFPFQNMKLIF